MCIRDSIYIIKYTARRQQQRHKFCIFNEQKEKLCTPLRAFFISVDFFSYLGEFVTSNDHFSSFTENVNTQARISILFSSFEFSSWVACVAGAKEGKREGKIGGARNAWGKGEEIDFFVFFIFSLIMKKMPCRFCFFFVRMFFW